MVYWKELIAVFGSYALGCFSAGYYLVRRSTGQDIRRVGSGSTGGRNVGRLLGEKGFIITVLIDLGKGAVAVGAASFLGLKPWAITMVMLAVVIGHIWPVQLRFHGGKGIATSLGALLVYDYVTALIIVVLCLGVFILTRNLTMSGLAAVAGAPLVPLFLGRPQVAAVTLFTLAVIVLFAHKKNIMNCIGG